MFGKILSLVTHYLAIFDALTERGVWVVSISDLYKPFHDHDVTIILFSTFSLNLKMLNKKEKKIQKFEYLENDYRNFGEIKCIFDKFLRAFFQWNIKIAHRD